MRKRISFPRKDYAPTLSWAKHLYSHIRSGAGKKAGQAAGNRLKVRLAADHLYGAIVNAVNYNTSIES